jgi:surfeit locus 1 family protein
MFLTVVLLAVPVCTRLGFWQLDRLQQRRARTTQVRERLAMPPIQPGTQASDLENLEYRRVVLQGQFDPDHEILLTNRSYQEQPGAHLVTPLVLAGAEEAVLVDRGWIPASQAAEDELDPYHLEGEVKLEGILRRSRPEPRWSFLADPVPEPEGAFVRRWRVLNVERIQIQMPYPLAPYFIEQDQRLGRDSPQPIPDPDIDLSEGPHLSYAIQWFSFAGIGLFGGVAWLYHRLRLSGGTKEA